jgi:hypothetical protein
VAKGQTALQTAATTCGGATTSTTLCLNTPPAAERVTPPCVKTEKPYAHIRLVVNIRLWKDRGRSTTALAVIPTGGNPRAQYTVPHCLIHIHTPRHPPRARLTSLMTRLSLFTRLTEQNFLLSDDNKYNSKQTLSVDFPEGKYTHTHTHT